MSELVHFEYPPPRSWEQFEELCADLFEAMWSDPTLVRHGRAGQAQSGVDIVAARGGIYPIGLQCKNKSRWPVQKLTSLEVDDEVKKAEQFSPTLKELYILTTAPADERLQRYVRTLNESRQKQKRFPVEILFWTEIVRRVARFEQVARKHFPIVGSKNEFSPLLATWYTVRGILELKGDEWHLAVCEIREDFHDWPTGRVVVRQRETDQILAKLQKLEKMPVSPERRAEKIKLRREVRYLQERERSVQQTIRILYTNETLRFYVADLDETGVDAREILKAIIESRLRPGLKSAHSEKIRLLPPTPDLLTGPRSPKSVIDSDIPVDLPANAYADIRKREQEFPKEHGGNAMAKVVSELPASVRRHFAIPAIICRIERIMSEDGKSLADMQLAGYLDLNRWNYGR